jgi:hypothetical protein
VRIISVHGCQKPIPQKWECNDVRSAEVAKLGKKSHHDERISIVWASGRKAIFNKAFSVGAVQFNGKILLKATSFVYKSKGLDEITTAILQRHFQIFNFVFYLGFFDTEFCEQIIDIRVNSSKKRNRTKPFLP